jgi:hypothetical protein
MAAAWNPKCVPLETLQRYVLAGDVVGLFRDTAVSCNERKRGRPASPSGSQAELAIQEFHVCTAIAVVVPQSTKRPTPPFKRDPGGAPPEVRRQHAVHPGRS